MMRKLIIFLLAPISCFGQVTINGVPGQTLAPFSTTVNGQTCTLGSTCTIPLSAINPQTTTYQVLAADFSNYKTITVASGTFTITLVASGSQPLAGQYIHIINYGSGVVTIAVSGQNINDGSASLSLPAGSATAPTSTTVWSDGTNYFANLSGASSTYSADGATLSLTGSTFSVNTAAIASRVTATQGLDSTCVFTSGSSSAYAGAVRGNALTAYADGMTLRVEIDTTANGGPITVNCGPGAVPVYQNDGVSNPTSAQWQSGAGNIQTVVFNGALNTGGTPAGAFVLQSGGSGSSGDSSAFSGLLAATGTNTIDNTNYAQTWNWSTATTQNPLSMNFNGLTSGSAFSLLTNNASLASTNGFMNVANTGAASGTSIFARLQPNSTSGSGLTILNNGNAGIGTTNPSQALTVSGNIQATNLVSYALSCTMPVAVNDYVNIGSFVPPNGTMNLLVSVSFNDIVNQATIAKQYAVSTFYNETSGAWQVVTPISNSLGYSTYQDFALEVSVLGYTVSLRLQKLASTNTGNTDIQIIDMGGIGTFGLNSFTPSTSTGSASAVTAIFSGGLAPLASIANAQFGSYNLDNWNGSGGPIGAYFGTNKNNGGSSPAAPQPALVLDRNGIPMEGGPPQSWDNIAEFNLSRYANVSRYAKTQLDIALTDGDGDAKGTNILSLQSGGNVGIGVTSPGAILDVTGNASAIVARFFDQTSSTGVTKVTVQDGAGQGATPSFRVTNNAGTAFSVAAQGAIGTGIILTDSSGACWNIVPTVTTGVLTSTSVTCPTVP